MGVEVAGFIGTVRPGHPVVCRFRTRDAAGVPVSWTGLLQVVKGEAETEVGVTFYPDVRVDSQPEVGSHFFVIDTAADPSVYEPGQSYLLRLYGDEVGGEPVAGLLVGSFATDNLSP